jgi:hypothetical protein
MINDTTSYYLLNYEPITNNIPRHKPSPYSLSGPTRLYLAVSSSSSSSSSTIAVFVCHCRHHHHHGVGCYLVPPAAPSLSSRLLMAPSWILDRHAALTADALRYDAASAAPARAPLFEKRDDCTSTAVTADVMPQSPLWAAISWAMGPEAHWC